MALLRRVLGDTLRSRRLRQRRTLREVSGAARVSLGYLSEIERGQKEASSELLAAICAALDVRLSDLLREVSDTLVRTETPVRRVPAAPRRELAGVGPRPTAPMPRLPVPRQDVVPTDRDQVWEPVGADGTAELPESTERPLEPVGTSQAMFDRLDPETFPAQGVGGSPGSELGSGIRDSGVVSLSARRSVVAAA